MFKDKHIVVGVCGGIAAYKAAGLVSQLRQNGADVHCILTEHAAKLVTPITFGELSGNDVTVDMFAILINGMLSTLLLPVLQMYL